MVAVDGGSERWRGTVTVDGGGGWWRWMVVVDGGPVAVSGGDHR